MFIRVTHKLSGKRVEIALDHITMVHDNGQGQPAELSFRDGASMEVAESGQSIRGYIKKASAGQSED